MQIRDTKTYKRCTDGSLNREYILDTEVDEGFIRYLGSFGTLTMKNVRDISFFLFEKEGLLTLKGMAGDRSIHGKYRKEDTENVTEFLNTVLSGYSGQ